MSQQRRKIIMNGQERFRISDTNPNAAIGLPGCLGCGSPYCPGPYMVFPTRVLVSGSNRLAFVSISLACAKKAVIQYESGGEISRVGSGREDDVDDISSNRADIERSAELLERLGVSVDQDELHDLLQPDNPYFTTGVGRNGVPLHRVLDELRSAERLAEIPYVDPADYDPVKAAEIAAEEAAAATAQQS